MERSVKGQFPIESLRHIPFVVWVLWDYSCLILTGKYNSTISLLSHRVHAAWTAVSAIGLATREPTTLLSAAGGHPAVG